MAALQGFLDFMGEAIWPLMFGLTILALALFLAIREKRLKGDASALQDIKYMLAGTFLVMPVVVYLGLLVVTGVPGILPAPWNYIYAVGIRSLFAGWVIAEAGNHLLRSVRTSIWLASLRFAGGIAVMGLLYIMFLSPLEDILANTRDARGLFSISAGILVAPLIFRFFYCRRTRSGSLEPAFEDGP